MKDEPKYANMNLSMKDAKEKLMDLKLPEDTDNLMNEFGKFLSKRLNETLVPIGFVMACELALYDLSKGIDGFTSQPIRNRLVGYPGIIYKLIRMRIPEIAVVIFPEDFAKEVANFIEHTKKSKI